VERGGGHVVRESEAGTVSISGDAIAQIAGVVAAESYGIVGMAGRRGLSRLRARDRLRHGIAVRRADEGVVVDMSVVVEHGLNLAEVAKGLRDRVAFEVERLTGLAVAAVDVRVEQVRKS